MSKRSRWVSDSLLCIFKDNLVHFSLIFCTFGEKIERENDFGPTYVSNGDPQFVDRQYLPGINKYFKVQTKNNVITVTVRPHLYINFYFVFLFDITLFSFKHFLLIICNYKHRIQYKKNHSLQHIFCSTFIFFHWLKWKKYLHLSAYFNVH